MLSRCASLHPDFAEAFPGWAQPLKATPRTRDAPPAFYESSHIVYQTYVVVEEQFKKASKKYSTVDNLTKK
jgi:hypothetical protein